MQITTHVDVGVCIILHLLQADDDTFVVVENLRYFLSDRNPMEPVYYGHHFKTEVKPQGFYGGGIVNIKICVNYDK